MKGHTCSRAWSKLVSSLIHVSLPSQGIVTSMIEHSASFKDKTKFSQEKYIKKKEKK